MKLWNKVGLTVAAFVVLLAVIAALSGGVGTVEMSILLVLLAGALAWIWWPRRVAGQ
jgi:hypothetical protein